MQHDLAYRGIQSGSLQVTDLYATSATDADIEYYKMRAFIEDKGYFPEHKALFVYRSDLLTRFPDLREAPHALESRISAEDMIAMNGRAKLHDVHEEEVAVDFIARTLGKQLAWVRESHTDKLVKYTKDHLFLVCISLLTAITLGVLLGIAAFKIPSLAQIILRTVNVIQTVPSLALLVMMIPLLGIGAVPAIVALFLYSLLPIVRNTYQGLFDISSDFRESSVALGLPGGVRLRLIEIPMASRAILAGIKTSAVINIGTAILGALIGAGSYGQPILTGIRLDDTGLILLGAIPAAELALLARGFFEVCERFVVPKGLKI